MEWAGGQAVVALPEHIGASNAGQVREELLSVINRGATTLIADMTATISCDYAGADAVVRAYQRAVSSGTELRLVVTARVVLQVLSLSGLDRLVSVYPSLEAALAAGPAAAAPSPARPRLAPGRSPCSRQPSRGRERGSAGPGGRGTRRAAGRGGAGGRRWHDRGGQRADGGHVRLRSRRAAWPSSRVTHTGWPADSTPRPPCGLRGGTRESSTREPAGGRWRAAGRAAQGRHHVPGPDQPHPGHDRGRAVHLRRDPRHHSGAPGRTPGRPGRRRCRGRAGIPPSARHDRQRHFRRRAQPSDRRWASPWTPHESASRQSSAISTTSSGRSGASRSPSATAP